MPEKPVVPESLGRRIAGHRAKLGWTQQELADRLAVSRVAVSHLEAGMSDPGERTVALLASVFKIEPHLLVEGTAYPTARAERLPVVVAYYTEIEAQLLLLESELVWLQSAPVGSAREAIDRWTAKLRLLLDSSHDRREREAVIEAQQRLRLWSTGRS